MDVSPVPAVSLPLASIPSPKMISSPQVHHMYRYWKSPPYLDAQLTPRKPVTIPREQPNANRPSQPAGTTEIPRTPCLPGSHDGFRDCHPEYDTAPWLPQQARAAACSPALHTQLISRRGSPRRSRYLASLRFPLFASRLLPPRAAGAQLPQRGSRVLHMHVEYDTVQSTSDYRFSTTCG
ncbi:hypothetical protein N658DRAFT_112433 [Parathielavia hyrcaniae]|uniref:Uncharacterized protein n=1 Tax=Parathielavia hyrcaniae TaxID=113614 RepID=A0AAN6T5Z0_9PEZI|nr:hypothetical protein N658DRAFT_112433 [Parathielavia hyrcaniae]